MDEIARVARQAACEGLTDDFGVGRVSPNIHDVKGNRNDARVRKRKREKCEILRGESFVKACCIYGYACGMMMLCESFRMPHSSANVAVLLPS